MFLLLSRLSPQAKDLCRKLSTNDNITLSPAYGGRKKQNGESGQLQRLFPQKQIGRTSSGENSLFSPLARSRAGGRRQSPFLSETWHSAVCVSQRSRTKERGLWFTPNPIRYQNLFTISRRRREIVNDDRDRKFMRIEPGESATDVESPGFLPGEISLLLYTNFFGLSRDFQGLVGRLL